jgi:hypothetical protein
MFKNSVSISHTPEGTNTERKRLIVAALNTISKAHEESETSIDLCTTPVVSGGVTG